MGYVQIIDNLAKISNVALLVVPMVQFPDCDAVKFFYLYQ